MGVVNFDFDGDPGDTADFERLLPLNEPKKPIHNI
jgi:hypothetical protein